MRAVVQRVNKASVTVNDEIKGDIKKGIVVLLGISENDTQDDIDYLVDKILNLRIFEDDNGKMNLSLLELDYELLIISQFTLYGDCRKGRRPNFTEAAKPQKAQDLYNKFILRCKATKIKVETGIFQEDMQVNLINDGPVTIIIDSKRTF